MAPNSVAMLFYDFLPLLRSDLFTFSNTLTFMPYTRLARMVRYTAFISTQTRQEYVTRILQQRGSFVDVEAAGPVLPLGGNGLAIKRQLWSPRRKLFASLGSIDGRKNQHRIALAFMRLWDAGYDIPLVLIGHAYDDTSSEWLNAARQYPQFCLLDSATDEEVVAVLCKARATIFASEAEGYGLPPIESLAAGIPVIASDKIPSLAVLPPDGQIRLLDPTVEAIAEAVLTLQPDAAARRLWREAAALQVSDWSDFAAHTAEWCMSLTSKPKKSRWSTSNGRTSARTTQV